MADLGETLRFRSDVTDASGTLVNASSASLVVTAPDGTSTALSPLNPPASTGQYVQDYTPTQSGRYVGAWSFVMGGGQVTTYVETFDVGASLVTVDEAVAHLRASGIVTTADDLEQLQWLCFVATDAIERDLDRAIVRRTVVETHDGGCRSIILRSTPVASVTSVTEAGTARAVGTYTLDAAAGILYAGAGTYSGVFAWGQQNVTVTYVAGYTDPPRIVRKVALNAIQGMWQSSQQAPHPLLDEDVAVFSVTAALSPVEQRAYDSLRSVAVA